MKKIETEKLEPIMWENFVSQMTLAKNVFSKNSKVLVAVSGGPDSIFLSYLVYKYSQKFMLKPVLCYINHNVRPMSEIKKDIDVIKNFAIKFNLKFVCSEIKPKNVDENTLRVERYNKLFSIARKLGCSLVLTGHTKNDVVETFLFNLFRGSGIRGLTGISSFREVIYKENKFYILRPLIRISKEKILEFLNQAKIKYSVDETNFKNFYARNFIRNIILTKLKKFFPQCENNIINTANILYEIQNYLFSEVRCAFDNSTKILNKKTIYLDFKKFLMYNTLIQKEILHQILEFLFLKNNISFKSSYNKIIGALMQFLSSKSVVFKINKNLVAKKKGTRIVFKITK